MLDSSKNYCHLLNTFVLLTKMMMISVEENSSWEDDRFLGNGFLEHCLLFLKKLTDLTEFFAMIYFQQQYL